jgi:hypothetical protein
MVGTGVVRLDLRQDVGSTVIEWWPRMMLVARDFQARCHRLLVDQYGAEESRIDPDLFCDWVMGHIIGLYSGDRSEIAVLDPAVFVADAIEMYRPEVLGLLTDS